MPDIIPIPSESREPLRARLPAACAPSDAALRDLTPKRMVLVRGGEHVSAEGGGFGGSLSADRYFLVLLDHGYEETQGEAPNTRTLSLRGKVLEVFPRGDRLDLDVARSVRSRTESTTLRIPLRGGEPSASALAIVEEKHAALWRDEFVQVWQSTAPLSVSRDAEDLAYHHASGRINSLADSAAVQAMQQNLGMHNPKPLRELLEKGETSGSKNLLDLEAVHARKSLRYTLMKAVNAVSPEPLLGAQDLSDGRPFSTHQLVAVEAAMGEAFGMKGSFAANEWLTPFQALKESAAIEKTYGMRVGQIAGMHVNIGEVFPSVEFVRGQGMTPTFEVEMTDDDVARNKIFLDARRGGFQAVERQKAEALASVRARTIPVRGMPSQPISEVFRLAPPAQIGRIGVTSGDRRKPDSVVQGRTDYLVSFTSAEQEMPEGLRLEKEQVAAVFPWKRVKFGKKSKISLAFANLKKAKPKTAAENTDIQIPYGGGFLTARPYAGESVAFDLDQEYVGSLFSNELPGMGAPHFSMEHPDALALFRASRGAAVRIIDLGDTDRTDSPEGVLAASLGEHYSALGDAFYRTPEDISRQEMFSVHEAGNHFSGSLNLNELRTKLSAAQSRYQTLLGQYRQPRPMPGVHEVSEQDALFSFEPSVPSPKLLQEQMREESELRSLGIEIQSLRSQILFAKKVAEGSASVRRDSNAQQLARLNKRREREQQFGRTKQTPDLDPETLLARAQKVGIVRVGGMELDVSDLTHLGSTLDGDSDISRQRAGAPGEVPERRIGSEGDVFAARPVTLRQALKMDAPGFVVYGPAGRQTAAEFLQTFRTSGVDAAGEVFHTWDASLFTRTPQAEGLRSLTLPATLLPGMGKAGTVTVGADFYKSLFRVPLSEYEKDEEKRARMEDTRPRRNGKPYSREEWTPDAGQATRRDLSRAIGRLEDDHPLRPLQVAMEAVPELDSLLRKGRYAPGGFDRFVLHISGDREARNQSVIRTGGIGPLESVDGARIGIREVLRLRSEISQTHLGGASVDPLRLLRDARMMRGAAEAELRTSVFGEKFERAKEEGALPTLSEALDWTLDREGRLPTGAHDANDAARLLTRKFVESGAWKSRSLKPTAEAQGTFDNSKGEENTFDRLDAGNHSATGPVETDPFLGVQERVVAEQEARTKSPESPGNASYLSVRDFFGRLGSYWNSETKSFTTAPGTSAEVARALEVLSDGENDLLAGNRRAGAFFGYGYDPAKGAQSFRALTAVEYSDPGVRRMTPSAEAFDFLRGLSPNEQGLVARRAGLASSARDRMPMDTSQGAAPGYWKFLEGGERQGWLSGDPYDVKLSGTQFDLLQRVFRPAALDSLILDRDTPQHAQQVDRFLRDPSRPLSPLASTTHLNPPGVTPAMRPVSAGAGQEDLGAVFEIARTLSLRVAAVQDGREEALGLLKDDEDAVMLNGVLRPLSPGVVHVNADQLTKGVDRAKWRPRTDPAELVSLKQLSVPGGTPVILSPQLSDSPIGSPEVLEQFFTAMKTDGAKVVGFDIESGTTLRRDANGKVLRDSKGKALKDTARLRNVGGELYEIGPSGDIMSQRNAFDVASSSFKGDENRQRRAADASLARESARFGETDEQKLVSAAYANLSAQDEDAFFMAFNARFDVGIMGEKAKAARDATQKVLAETESREGVENTRLRESLAHFEEAFRFFSVDMPRRTIEASHLFELSGAQREDNTLKSFLTALNVIKGPQKHTSLWDVQKMMEGAFQSLFGFLGGETPTLEDVAPGQYVFPYNVSGGVVMEKGKPVLNADGSVRRTRSKDPFQLTGIERETLDRDSKVTLFGRNIDEQGNPFGEVREMASFHRGSELQRSLTIGTNYGGLQITGENNEEYWKTSLSDDNLRDIIERNVRRAVGYQGAGKGEADLDRRAEYLARAEIVKGYEATADHEKQGYLHALAADLVPDSSGRYRPRRSEFGMLFRTDGTIDTSTAQEVIPFVNTKTGDRLRTWFMSKETQGDNPGFLVPSTRQSALRTGEILADRPQDQVFQSLIHEAGARGILGAEEVRAAAEGYNSIAESRYPATLREIDGPLSVSVRTVEGGFRAMTRLRSDMSRDAVYDALFEHGLSTSHSVQKAVRNATPEVGPPDNLSTRGAEFSRTMTERILRDVRAAAPEFAGIGTQTRPASLWDLAGEVHSALVQSTRKTLVRDDLDHSMLRLRDGSEETQEGWARQLGRDTRTAIPTSPEDVENFLANPENPRALARALASTPSLNNGYLATDAYALSMPPMRSSGMNESVLGNLKASGHGLSLPPVAASHIPQAAAGPGETQGLEPPVDSSATLLQRAISEEAGSAAERMVAAAERAGETAGRSRVGVVLGALAALALVGDVGDRMIDVGAARGGAVPPGTPVSTTAHNAGPEDIALQSTESQSYKEGIEGWQKLQVTVDCEHPGFPGSGRRLDQSALDAFSSDISSVLEAHFGNATPTRTSSQDKRHDTGLRWKAASLVRRAVNRHGIPSGAGV